MNYVIILIQNCINNIYRKIIETILINYNDIPSYNKIYVIIYSLNDILDNKVYESFYYDKIYISNYQITKAFDTINVLILFLEGYIK